MTTATEPHVWVQCSRGCDISPTVPASEAEACKEYHERVNRGHKLIVQDIPKVTMDADEIAAARYLDWWRGR